MTTKYAIKQVDGPLFIHSDIDSSGMSVVLAERPHADTFPTDDEAEAFLRRCSARYPATPLEVVPC